MRKMYILLWIATGLLLLCSCKSIKYVPVETVRTDSLYITVHEKDSVHVHDSIYVREKGDTVFVDRWHTKYRDRQRTDTMYVARTDSVQVPYPVERELTKWESFKMEMGGWAFGVILSAVLFVIVWLVYKKRDK